MLTCECLHLKITVELFLLRWIRQRNKCFYFFCYECIVKDRNVTKSIKSEDFGLQSFFMKIQQTSKRTKNLRSRILFWMCLHTLHIDLSVCIILSPLRISSVSTPLVSYLLVISRVFYMKMDGAPVLRYFTSFLNR